MTEKTCPQDLKDLLKALYGFSSQEVETLNSLCGEERRVEELADRLEKDRSTVQRYLSSLKAANLVERKSKVNKGGKGRFYIYKAEYSRVKKVIEARFQRWEKEKLESLESMKD
ncbi:MAG: ArsR family transcriptional regulator [Candidatus Nanohaloarchaeota archaeon QJJ-9]|nr:ArsR family transcriptional regulator [Candidatus Nanohaloarchaeota archaeon QJJ-9]